MHLGVILGKFWALPTLSIVHIFSLSINALLRYALLGADLHWPSVLASTARIEQMAKHARCTSLASGQRDQRCLLALH